MKHLNSRLSLAALALLPSLAHADPLSGGNTAWILTATALVLFMTLPGLSLFYGGLVAKKNVLSIFMQCFAIGCMASLLWLVVGYSIAFGDGGALNGFWGGLDKAFLNGVNWDSTSGDIPESLFVLFQMTFAIITPALIIGGFAERMRFSAVMIFSALWLLLVYFPVCHWVWGGGWLGALGVLDFAGGIVVHITCGTAALVAALVLGPRRGFPKRITPPHNLPMTVMGAGMLWVGWFGFNGGSALAADQNAAMAMLVTHLSAAAGSLAWMVCEWTRHGKPSVLGIVTGMVAGLGTITPASGSVGPMGGVIIGLTAGVVCYFATQTIKTKLKIDDSLDVFPVHGVGGILGTLLCGIFVVKGLGGVGLAEGVSMGGQLMVQIIGIVATLAWTAIISFILLKLTDKLVGLRVSEEDETTGLDLTMHEEQAYND